MKRQKVESSNLAEVGYNLPTLTLQIKFHHGGIYNYWPIGRYTYEGLMKAKAKCIYFNQHIRGASGISFEKIDEL